VQYWHLCSARLQRVILAAHDMALRRGSPAIDPEHLVLAVLALEDCTASRLLAQMGVDVQGLGAALRAQSAAGLPGLSAQAEPEDVRFSARAERIMQATWLEARRAWGRRAQGSAGGRIGTEHLLLGITNPASGVRLSALHTHGVFHGELAEWVRRLEAAADGGEAG